MIRHIVALRFRADVDAAMRAELMAALRALRGSIGGILDFRHSANISPEKLVIHGFGHVFWFDFTDAAARDAYLIHPLHRAIGTRLVLSCIGGTDGIQVLDVQV